MEWTAEDLKERISEVVSKFVNERIDTHSFDCLFKEIYRGTGIAIKIGTNADMVWNGEHSVYITSRALQHEESASVFKLHFAGTEFKRYMMILPRVDNLLKLNKSQEEETQMNNEYKPLIDILREVGSGDILERERDGQGIVLDGAVFSWYDIENDKRTGTIALTTAVLQSKFRILPKYVGWREAFEVYENGGTIECEYGGEMVWFNRSITSLEESSMLADKQLEGLLETKWIIKKEKR